ncbi:MAG: hypothetical protein IT195_07565 [Microthrixaceae bacterium]|nr:hypothetical protein [Microthrixaceae bacterium]
MQTRRARRRALVTALTIALAGAELARMPVADATPSNVVPSASSVAAPVDYFENQWGDPMDFANGEDLDLTPGRMVQDGSAGWESGKLRLWGVGQVFLLRGDPGGLPNSAIRDPRSRILDGSRFSRITFRMHSNRAAVGAIGFRTCGSCADGYSYFDIHPGWHTYDLDMRSQQDHETFQSVAHSGHAGSAWEGDISLLYLSPAFNEPTKPNLLLEDFSVYEPSPSLSVTLSGGSGNVELWYDTDDNQLNDGVSGGTGPEPTANRIGTFAAGSNVSLASGIFRRNGAVRFYTSQSETRSGFSSAVTMPVTSRPAPVVFSPSESGGVDWAAEVRGDPWDMNQSSDIWETANVSVSWSGGEMHAAGAGARNDPVFVLNQSGRAIDATRYRKIAVTIAFDGPWGLEDAPGGGLVGRIVWKTLDGGIQQVSLPMVENVSKSTYIVDLNGTASTDPVGTPDIRPWGSGAGTFVSQLRFDPHEDPGGRSWHLDDVKLLRNESVSPTFDIHFADTQWAGGTTADLYADTDRSAGNGLGTRIATNLTVGQGTQTYRWNGAGVGPGSYFVHAVLYRGGLSSVGTSTGRVDVGIGSAGNPVIGAPPAAAPSGPTQEQLIAFFNFILRTKFFCAVARARRNLAVGRAPICNQLLGPWRPPRRRR